MEFKSVDSVVNYINWNWADSPQWSKWSDTKLEANEIVK